MRQQEAFPLILKQQAEKQKLSFNKQWLLHTALILGSCLICVWHITVCTIVNQSCQKWPSSMVLAGWKSLEVLPAACVYPVDTQKELWEPASSGLFSRQLGLSKVNGCNKHSCSLLAPDTADFLMHISPHWPGLRVHHWKPGREAALVCVCMVMSSF